MRRSWTLSIVISWNFAPWEAIENAGHPPESFPGSIGVFAGSGMNAYMVYNLLQQPSPHGKRAGLFLDPAASGNDKDVLATRVSYQLDLRGPSMSVQTACSTSLVAVHLRACQSLLNCVVRHGTGRRRDDRDSSCPWLYLSRGRDSLA